MLGDYAVADDAVRFTPLFPFDQGRQYHVRFEPSRLPGGGADAGGVIEATVGRPASTAVPSTVVARVYPSGDVVPENLLRMYVEFSAPMGRKSGVEYISLLDHAGKEIPGAVLPLDYEFWSPDHTRFTVFFDPGRVKKGILPNRADGPAARSGTFGDTRHQPRVARCERAAAQGGVPARPSRRSDRSGSARHDRLAYAVAAGRQPRWRDRDVS